MEIIKWTEEYSVGIKEIDNQHKGLVILINELFTLMTKGKSKDSLSEIFNYLTDYTKKHFFTEETLLYKYAYPEIDQHKLEHSKFIENLNNLKSDFKTGKITISIETLNFLKDWLLNHIKLSDKRYSVYILKVDTEK